MNKEEKDKFNKKFEEKLKYFLDDDLLTKLKYGESLIDDNLRTDDYEQFRIENLPKSFSLYEKACYYAQKLLNVSPDKKSYEKIEKALEEAHLYATPEGAQSLSILICLIFLFLGLGILPFISIFGVGLIIVSLIIYYFFQQIPFILKNIHISKTNDQIILAVFYLVSFMRYNSNFELAVAFAANYIGPPLSLDFKKLLWEVNNNKYPNLKRAFDAYLDKWKDKNLEFLESIYLIESSLLETNEATRLNILDKSLDILLQGNYEKMLHFIQDLKGRVNTFNMLGLVFPILFLIILPLAASFGDPKSVWETSIVLYVLILPVILIFYSTTLTIGKPGSSNSINMKNLTKKKLKESTKIPIKIGEERYIYLDPIYYSLIIFLLFALITFFPILIKLFSSNLYELLDQLPLTELSNGKFILFRDVNNYKFGPYGIYPGILSIIFVSGLGISIGYYFLLKYKKLINIRNKTKQLENEFPTIMLQLGNRIGEGVSVELAFNVIANNLKGTVGSDFFQKIDSNIKFNGMSVERAIFDPIRGAIKEYPSDIVTSSMKILTKTIDQGPEIVSKNLISLSRYLSELHKARERLIDLLAEPLSSMKSQKSFMGPIITGIVVSIVYLITTILGTLKTSIGNFTAEASGVGGIANANSILGDSIPTALFQLPVGLYLLTLVFVLVYIINELEEGNDSTLKKYDLGVSLISTMKKYMIVTIAGLVLFAIVGKQFIVLT